MDSIEKKLEVLSQVVPLLVEKVVFVGGSITELLITDSGGRKPRPTEDLDCIIEVGTLLDYNKIEKYLREAGFENDIRGNVICRWKYQSLLLDVMPTNKKILGFSNKWYKSALRKPVQHILSNRAKIQIIHPVYYFATKTEAFINRGKNDYRSSHDFEDIILLINGRVEIVDEFLSFDAKLRTNMTNYWRPKICKNEFITHVYEHLDAYEDNERTNIVMDRWRKMFQ